jgi:transglutaminase-like putative cysteine protease
MTEGAGVCQDHTQVLIAAAHMAGLPARYVSGYLNATEDGTRMKPAMLGRNYSCRWPGLGWL